MRRLVFLLFLLLACAAAAAQEPRITAFADMKEMGVDDTLNLTLRVEGNASSIGNPVLPSMDDFRVVGQSQSMSTQIINFDVRRTKDFIFILAPRRQGQLKIPPMTITVDGKTYRTDSINVSVKEGSLRQAAPQHRSVWDPWGGFPQESRRTSDAEVERGVFIEADADRKVLYVGEPAVVTYYLFSRYPVLQVSFDSTPTFSNCVSQELENLKQRTPDEVSRNGEAFYRIKLMQFLVTPTKPGRHVFSALRMQVDINLREPFGFFAVTGGRSLRKQSPEITVDARPLPPPPAGFSGAVGVFELSVQPPRTPLRTTDVDALTLTVQGRGNLRTAQPPEFPETAGLTVHPPEVKVDTFTDRPQEGRMTMRYPILPRLGGIHRIPPLHFTYFNPQTGNYETLSSEPLALTVEGAPGTPSVPVLPSEARPGGAVPERRPFYEPLPLALSSPRVKLPLWPAAAGLPLLWTAGLGVARLWNALNLEERLGLGHAAGKRRLSRAMREARKAFMNREPQKALESLHDAWNAYLAAKYKAASSNLTASDVDALLAQSGAEPELRRACVDVSQKIEAGRYSPFGAQEGLALLARMRNAVAELEKS